MVPKVSIILTTHGEAPFLKQAIGSVLAQTFESWELVVAVDSEKTKTGFLLDRPYAAWQFLDGEICFDNLRIINLHVSDRVKCRFASTINQAFKYTKGDFITYLCHDDLYLPWRLGMMVGVMEAQKWDVAFGWQELFDQDSGMLLDPGRSPRKGDPDCPGGTVDHSSVMHRRECFEKAGGWDESAPPRYGDMHFWFRLQKAGYRFNCIPEVLDVHRFNQESISWKLDHPKQLKCSEPASNAVNS